ncbi:MAG TPA: hypothetical protein VEP90_04845 [Methylomirabilota bacterium]|nr:hypothetical protein [Methylomirabilota bacterium]
MKAAKQKTKPFMIYPSQELLERLRKVAEKNFRTMSGEAQLAIQKHVDAEEKNM